MKITIVKPDWRITGGFEKVLGRIEADLQQAGHQVDWALLDVPSVARRPFGFDVPTEVWDRGPEWFSHLALLEAFRNLDVSGADLVLTTQPPSYAVRHDRTLALFYHHARAFYDLEDVWIGAGLAPAGLHTVASALLREAESADLAGVRHFLAGSERVMQRLHQFQGDDLSVGLYQAAGPAVEADGTDEGRFEHVLCVSRHEFTKRTELAVAAIAAAPSVDGVLAGAGGRLPFVRALAGELAAGRDPQLLTGEDLWLNRGVLTGGRAEDRTHPRIDIRGRVEDDELDALYRGALVVVAPAYDEDDGLTVAEAMARGKPVIVCRDGGGLTALVRDGENGFVVEPTPAGIAAAIETLAGDRELARRMGAAARETAATRTPERATSQLLTAVETVMAGG